MLVLSTLQLGLSYLFLGFELVTFVVVRTVIFELCLFT